MFTMYFVLTDKIKYCKKTCTTSQFEKITKPG